MSKKNLVIKHDLSKLSPEELTQYLRDVSTFIGLDPDLNALDTIWMPNENGPGQSRVVYARRGTAEILRNELKIEVSSLVHQMVKGSIVFTATGKNGEGRQEMAIGSKCIEGLQGKVLDDAIMTASTRALRRLTMQFTSLGILDESEVRAILGDTSNPAAGAQLAGSSIVLPPAPTVVNNAPGRDITAEPAESMEDRLVRLRAEAATELDARKAAREAAETSATVALSQPVTSIPAPVTDESTSAKPKRARKSRNTVSLDGPEPEVATGPAPSVSAPEPPSTAPTAPQPPLTPATPLPTPVAPPAPVSGTTVPNQGTPTFPGQPNDTQMADYRKRVSVYTAELPSSENMGSVQKMRAFITKMSGNPPQSMTVEQWEEQMAFFESFVGKNGIKGLVKYINDVLGVK